MYDRYWLLTSTTYGNWLPGDRRGFVSGVRDGSSNAKIHNIPGTIYDADLPRIQEFARNAMKGAPHFADDGAGRIIAGAIS